MPPYSAALLHTFAFVLLATSMRQDEVSLVVPYTPVDTLELLYDACVSDGVLEPDLPGSLILTETGRRHALAVVDVHEQVCTSLWADHLTEVEAVLGIADALVLRGSTLPPPIEPAAFPFFASLPGGPEPTSRLLRRITALRYWRADAHRRAWRDAGLTAATVHALNRLWDEHRGVDRIGQNYGSTSDAAVEWLEQHGLADVSGITAAGIALREAVETETDVGCQPLFDELGAERRSSLLQGLTALPA